MDPDDWGADRKGSCVCSKERNRVFPNKESFKDYGKLSHKNLDDLKSGGRELLVSGQDEKEDPAGFRTLETEKGRRAVLGRHHGARAARAGTLSALRCPENIWASRSISMPAGKI